MAERNSSTSGTTRGTERGSTASTPASAAGTGTQQNKGQSAAGTQSRSTGIAARSEEQGIAGKVREQANARLSSQKNRALDGVGEVAQAVRKTTQSLREQQHDTVARYVDQAASQIERITQNLKNKDVGELLEDAQRLARRQPALFIGSAFAIGLVSARFFKSSSPDYYAGEYRYSDYGTNYRTESGRSAYGSGEYGRSLPSTGSRSSSTSVTPGATPGTPSTTTNYPSER